MHHMAVSYDKNILTFYNIGIDWITNVQYGGTRCFNKLWNSRLQRTLEQTLETETTVPR